MLQILLLDLYATGGKATGLHDPLVHLHCPAFDKIVRMITRYNKEFFD